MSQQITANTSKQGEEALEYFEKLSPEDQKTRLENFIKSLTSSKSSTQEEANLNIASSIWVHKTRFPNDLIDMPEELDGEFEIKTGKWEESENQRYLEALKRYGKNWDKIQNYVKTRDSLHIRSHSQKLMKRLRNCVSNGCNQAKNLCIGDCQDYIDILSQKILDDDRAPRACKNPHRRRKNKNKNKVKFDVEELLKQKPVPLPLIKMFPKSNATPLIKCHLSPVGLVNNKAQGYTSKMRTDWEGLMQSMRQERNTSFYNSLNNDPYKRRQMKINVHALKDIGQDQKVMEAKNLAHKFATNMLNINTGAELQS